MLQIRHKSIPYYVEWNITHCHRWDKKLILKLRLQRLQGAYNNTGDSEINNNTNHIRNCYKWGIKACFIMLNGILFIKYWKCASSFYFRPANILTHFIAKWVECVKIKIYWMYWDYPTAILPVANLYFASRGVKLLVPI